MEKRNENKQENEVSWMKLLNKITKWFFKTAVEVNGDWKLVALDLNRELIGLQERYQRDRKSVV